MPDDLGPFSVSMYCDVAGNFHTDSFQGTVDCFKDKAIMVMETMYRSGACVGTVLGKSFTIECLSGPCPEHIPDFDMNKNDVMDEIRRSTVGTLLRSS